MNERCPTCHRAIKKDRSNNQNRYYWGVVVNELSEHTGFTPDEVHEILKHKFLWKVLFVKAKSGTDKVLVGKSTAQLTTAEFENFMRDVRQWASIELGVWIPEPNEAPTEGT